MILLNQKKIIKFDKIKAFKIMFRFFKKISKKEKLQDLYNKKKEKAFKLSRTNRKESDKLEKEANDILIEIEKIKE